MLKKPRNIWFRRFIVEDFEMQVRCSMYRDFWDGFCGGITRISLCSTAWIHTLQFRSLSIIWFVLRLECLGSHLQCWSQMCDILKTSTHIAGGICPNWLCIQGCGMDGATKHYQFLRWTNLWLLASHSCKYHGVWEVAPALRINAWDYFICCLSMFKQPLKPKQI